MEFKDDIAEVIEQAKLGNKNVCLFDMLEDPDPEYDAVFYKIGSQGIEDIMIEACRSSALWDAYDKYGYEDVAFDLAIVAMKGFGAIYDSGYVDHFVLRDHYTATIYSTENGQWDTFTAFVASGSDNYALQFEAGDVLETIVEFGKR